MTSDSISSGNSDSIHFRSPGQSTDDGRTVPDGNPVFSPGVSGEAPGEVGIVVEDIIEEVPLEGSPQSWYFTTDGPPSYFTHTNHLFRQLPSLKAGGRVDRIQQSNSRP